jgi:Big-like domain-containing protein
MRKVHVVVFAAVLAGSTGCGGSSSSPAAGTPPPGNTTRPMVTSFLPYPPSNLGVNVPLVFTFSEPMKLAANAITAYQLGGGNIPVTSSLSADGLTLTVHPSGIVVPGTVGIVMGNGVTDLAGNTLSGQFTFDFDYPSWLPLGGAIPPVDAMGFQGFSTAVDDKGRTVVAWSEYTASTGTADSQVYVSRWSGTAWEALGGALNKDPTLGATWPSVAFRAGKLAVAFGQATASGGEIDVRTWDDVGKAWSASIAGLTPWVTGASAYPISLALDSGGNPVVAWQRQGVPAQILVKRWTGSAWSAFGAALNVVTTENVSAPKLALDASDRPIVAFLEYAPSSINAYVESWNGTAFDVLGGGPLNSATVPDPPAVAVDGTGRSVAAWAEGAKVYVRIFNGTSAVGSSQVSAAGITAGCPSITLDAALGLLVGWSDVQFEACYVSSLAGAAWTQLPYVTTDAGSVCQCGQLAAGANALSILFKNQSTSAPGNDLRVRLYNR